MSVKYNFINLKLYLTLFFKEFFDWQPYLANMLLNYLPFLTAFKKL